MKMTNTIVSSVLIEDVDGKVLAVLINKEKKGGVWVPPGGKVELGESARETAIREAKEELNIDVEITDLVGILELDYDGTGKKTWVFLFYSGKIVGGTPTCMEEGKTLECKYVNKSELNYSEAIHWIK